MTELEDRVTAALRAGADEFTASPDAWEQTTMRARRRIRLLPSGLSAGLTGRRFTPLVAAAAVVAVAITTAALASTGSWHDLVSSRPATSTSTVKPPWYWQLEPSSKTPRHPKILEQNPAAVRRLMRLQTWLQVRPMCGKRVGAVTSFDKTNAWFSWGTGAYKDLYLCASYTSGSQAGPAGRGPLASTQGWASSGVSGDAVSSITSVTAVLANGRHVTGRVWRGHGLPEGLWAVNVPASESARFVFVNAAGRVVTQLNQTVSAPVNPLTNPTPLALTDMGDCANSGGWSSTPARVPQTMDGHKTWTYVEFGQSAGNGLTLCEFAGLPHRSTSFSTSVSATRSVSAAQPVQAEEDLLETDTISGISEPWVKSVTAVLADGKTYRGAFADGRGFPDPVWLVSFPAHATATLTFRDSAGEVVATLHGQNGNWPGVG